MVNLSALLKQSVSVYARHPVAFTSIALGSWAMSYLYLLLIDSTWWFFANMVNLLATELVNGALVFAAAVADSGRSPNFIHSYKAVLDRLGSLIAFTVRSFGAAFLLALTIVGIPFAIRILVRWSFGTQGVMLDNLGGKGAISLSCRLVEGRWWQIFGLILLVTVPWIALGLLLWLAGVPYIASSALSIVASPLLACFYTLLFSQLKERDGLVPVAI